MKQSVDEHDGTRGATAKSRSVRADAKRNIDALLEAALAVFTTSGVNAPVREIAERAGVGIGTLYRHFPQRSDLIAAVFRQQVDATADTAQTLAAEYPPSEALARWMHRYADFITAKRGLAAALHSGDPAYNPLHDYFDARLKPALQTLLDAAVSAGEVRSDITADDLLNAVRSLCLSVRRDQADYAHRMVDVFMDGLRYTPPS